MSFEDNTLVPLLFGEHNAHLDKIARFLSVEIVSRGNAVTIEGDKENIYKTKDLLQDLWKKLQDKMTLSGHDVDTALKFLDHSQNSSENFTEEQTIIRTKLNKFITARTPNQAKYIQSIRDNDMVFGLGPAGTGKTFLAVASAVAMYQEGLVERLVFCRPAVEAGERLGFLPGDMLEKIDPYLRPIYDALYECMPGDMVNKKMINGDIEIAPLAFMRGRTLKNAFVVLDEAQNTTSMQMKMFLTRMGERTRMVITGDPTQIDLPPGTSSGLNEAVKILRDIKEVSFIQFDSNDVVRHSLVTKIINAYEQHVSKHTKPRD